MDTSVSAVVRRYLTELDSGETERRRLKRQVCELRERIAGCRADVRMSGDELYRRGA